MLHLKIRKSTHLWVDNYLLQKSSPSYPSDIVGLLGLGLNKWKLVWHVPQGSNWHPDTDQLRCVHCYNNQAIKALFLSKSLKKTFIFNFEISRVLLWSEIHLIWNLIYHKYFQWHWNRKLMIVLCSIYVCFFFIIFFSHWCLIWNNWKMMETNIIVLAQFL